MQLLINCNNLFTLNLKALMHRSLSSGHLETCLFWCVPITHMQMYVHLFAVCVHKRASQEKT